jgi:hypothetical protein
MKTVSTPVKFCAFMKRSPTPHESALPKKSCSGVIAQVQNRKR